MAYTRVNYKTKKALKDAVASGDRVAVFNTMTGATIENAPREYVEGPHYPEAHKWYAAVKIENGIVTKVLQ
jgi:hypothetical protein